MRHHRIPVSEVESVHAVQVFVEESPTKPAIVSVHGTGGPGFGDTQWRLRLAKRAAREGFHFFIFDSRGCGYSDGEFENWTVSKFVEDTKSVINYVSNLHAVETPRIGLLGFSLGSAVCVLAASGHPDQLKALVVYTLPFDLDRNFLWYLERFVPRSLDKFHETKEGKVWLPPLGNYLKMSFLDDLRNHDVRKAIAALNMPMLLIQPTLDDQVPRWVSSQAYELKPEPKQWMDIEGTHSMTMRDKSGWNYTQEEIVTETVIQWMKEKLS